MRHTLQSPRVGENLLRALTVRFFTVRDRLIERANNLRVDTSSGLELQDLPDGPLVRIGRRFTEILPAQAPAAGIPARVGSTPGSAICTLNTWDGTTYGVGAGITVTVLNDYPGTVGNNKLIKVYRWANALWVGPESCS